MRPILAHVHRVLHNVVLRPHEYTPEEQRFVARSMTTITPEREAGWLGEFTIVNYLASCLGANKVRHQRPIYNGDDWFYDVAVSDHNGYEEFFDIKRHQLNTQGITLVSPARGISHLKENHEKVKSLLIWVNARELIVPIASVNPTVFFKHSVGTWSRPGDTMHFHDLENAWGVVFLNDTWETFYRDDALDTHAEELVKLLSDSVKEKGRRSGPSHPEVPLS